MEAICSSETLGCASNTASQPMVITVRNSCPLCNVLQITHPFRVRMLLSGFYFVYAYIPVMIFFLGQREILTENLCEIYLKSFIFGGKTLCSYLKVKRRFGGRCRLHLQSDIIDTGDGSNIFHRNVDWLTTECMMLFPEDLILHTYPVRNDI
jgi:hypothetical protein